MATAVQLVNIALAELGANPIVSFSDTTREANIASNLYAQTFKEVILDGGSWPSCIKRATLVENNTAPNHEYANAFDLPTDFLKLIKFNECIPSTYDYKVEGTKIVTDETQVKIVYLANITDPTLFDAWLEQAIILKLKAKLAYAITGSKSAKQMYLQEYIRGLPDLIAQADQQGSPSEIDLGNIDIIRD